MFVIVWGLVIFGYMVIRLVDNFGLLFLRVVGGVLGGNVKMFGVR